MSSKEQIVKMLNDCIKLEMDCLAMWKNGNNQRKAIYIQQSEKHLKWFKSFKNKYNEQFSSSRHNI